jgi:Domain of unknown function (DUF4326)
MRHRLSLSSGGCRRGELHYSPPRREFRSLLYDALDFSTDRDDGGGQTRESLSRFASPSAAVARLVIGRCLRGGKAARELWSRMSKPKRIQRSRSKGWKMPANAIYVGRPTVWGNPYVVGSKLMNGETLTAEKAVELYEQHLAENFSERDIRHCLRGKDLACWCALDEPCHADVLLRIANSRPK